MATVHDYSVNVRGYLGVTSPMKKERELGMSWWKEEVSSQDQCHAQG